MPRRRSIPRTFFVNMLVLAILSSFALGSVWILQEYRRFNEEAAALRERYLDARKSEMKTQVDQVVSYIQYKRMQTDQRIRLLLKERVLGAHALATHLHATYKKQVDLPAIEIMVRESLRAIRFRDGRGYYFATRMNGVNLLFADRPELEGKSILGMQDRRGAAVIRDMIELAREQGEGHYSYYWTKPNAPGDDHLKISYIKYFEPFDCYIGTGEYVEDVEGDIQWEAIDWIERIRFGDDYYVFAGQWDGLSLSGPAKGQNMLGVVDPNGVPIVRELIKRAKGTGGFVRYVMPKLEGQRPEPKISYARGVKEWEWYVGTGVYTDDIENAVAMFRAERLRGLRWNIAKILALLAALAAGSFLFARKIAHQTRRALGNFLDFFQKASGAEEGIKVKGAGFAEFDQLAGAANQMIARRREALAALREREERLRILFDQAADAVYVSDMDGRLIQVNAQARQSTGYTEGELLGMNVIDVDDDMSSPEELRTFFKKVSPGAPVTIASRHRRKDGTRFPVEITIARLDTPQGPRVLGIARDITERMQKQVEYARILETATDAFWLVDRQGRLAEVNPAAAEMLGYTVEEMKRLELGDIEAVEGCDEIDRRMRLIIEHGAAQFPSRHRRRDGSLIDVEVSASYVPFGDGRFVAFIRDVTERKREEEERRQLEDQLRQAQKMEAIGQLTGGVAHDFNNLLQVINGGTDLAYEELPAGHPAREALDVVIQAGDRAASLVSQLLVFSRRQIMRPEPLELNEVIGELLKMLQRVIGEHIRLQWHPASNLRMVNADRGMIEQAVMNLCVNARDAMPSGGVLTIETDLSTVDSGFCAIHPWAEPGEYVQLSVSDTGCGMETETLERMFEPFFSTKEEGRGTGLGLATVYGIIKQHDGMVHAYSEPGKGTVIRLYWPVCEATDAASVTSEKEEAVGGHETILLAEDDEMVRDLTCRILEGAGYTVLVTENGLEAVDTFRENRHRVDLAILDVVMPKMGGREAYDRMLEVEPGLRALFASGYSEHTIHKNFVLEEGVNLIQKPYTRRPLLLAIRRILDGSPGRDGD